MSNIRPPVSISLMSDTLLTLYSLLVLRVRCNVYFFLFLILVSWQAELITGRGGKDAVTLSSGIKWITVKLSERSTSGNAVRKITKESEARHTLTHTHIPIHTHLEEEEIRTNWQNVCTCIRDGLQEVKQQKELRPPKLPNETYQLSLSLSHQIQLQARSKWVKWKDFSLFSFPFSPEAQFAPSERLFLLSFSLLSTQLGPKGPFYLDSLQLCSQKGRGQSKWWWNGKRKGEAKEERGGERCKK